MSIQFILYFFSGVVAQKRVKDLQYMQRQKHKHWEKLGVKSNKTSQMHFRPQVVFWATDPLQLYIYVQLDINLCFTGTQKNIICAFYINDGTNDCKKTQFTNILFCDR